MVKKSDKRSGGVDIEGSVSAKGDIVGRDKTIQNILVVGQFLDYAQVEGLIPKLAETPDLESISKAFEKAFGERLGTDLAHATAATGEILKGFLVKMMPSQPFEALPFRDILEKIPKYLVAKLDTLKYWEAFRTRDWPKKHMYPEDEYIRLDSLSMLWRKTFGDNIEYFLVSRWRRPIYRLFRRENIAFIWTIERRKGGAGAGQIDFSRFGNEGFRVFMAGLVIDLIRLTSTASTDVKFWEGLTELLALENT